MHAYRHSILVLLLLAAPLSAQSQRTAATATKASPAPQPDLTERTYKLVHLNPRDAAQLVAPYVHPVYGGSVYEAGSIRAITIRETPAALSRIEALLKEHDSPAVTLVLRFQLIAAENTQNRDPAIAAVEAQLRDLFRFPGYRLLSEATATASAGEQFNLLIPADDERFQLNGHVMSVSTAEGDQTARLRVSLERPVPVALQGKALPGSILGTGLSVPIGQTVVLGSSTPGGNIQAIILVVRPEIVPKK